MGCHFSSIAPRGKSTNIQVTMYKFVAYSCLAAAVAYAAPSPDADADAHYGGYGLAHVGVAPAVHTVTTPKCTVTFEEIETQNCVPKTEKVCDTKDVEQESVTFEEECKEVTSKVCGGPHGLVHPHIIKREAEAELVFTAMLLEPLLWPMLLPQPWWLMPPQP